MSWIVYIVECKDQTFYTGITKDLPKRLAAHNAGKGAKYTRSRGPVTLLWSKGDLNETEAKKQEAAIKKLSRAQKEDLITGE